MVDILKEDFTNKVILEVGTGRGGTTRELVKILSRFKNTKLITTDIHDGNFEELKKEFKNYDVPVQFMQTDACKLEGIDEESIDYIVCNYTLCAINKEPGCEIIALDKFKSLLKNGGTLYIEEEFPINNVNNDKQQIWSEKWKILRTCTTILGESNYNEIKPEVLENILNILGFKEVTWESCTYEITGIGCLDFFQSRLNMYMKKITNEELKSGIYEMGEYLKVKTKKVEGMEVPIYRIKALKE